MTLIELLLATSLMTIIAGMLGMLAVGMQDTWQTNRSRSEALQQGRVALERITRNCQQAYVANLYRGFGVATTTIGSYTYPDTLVIWRPSGTPVNVNGPPKISECIFYCYNPSAPNELLEITAPTDSRDIPLDSQLSSNGWLTTLNQLKTANTSQRVVLTSQLRTALATANDAASRRGVLRFARTVSPSESAYAAYTSGTTNWQNLAWVQSVAGSQTGLACSRLGIELQLVAGDATTSADPAAAQPIGIFGAAALHYDMTR